MMTSNLKNHELRNQISAVLYDRDPIQQRHVVTIAFIECTTIPNVILQPCLMLQPAVNDCIILGYKLIELGQYFVRKMFVC